MIDVFQTPTLPATQRNETPDKCGSEIGGNLVQQVSGLSCTGRSAVQFPKIVGGVYD